MDNSPGLRSRQKQLRRERILDAARELFSERGYTATTIKEIADRAAVSPPTVHKYYGNKQQLLFDILTDEGADHVEDPRNLELDTKDRIDPVSLTTRLLGAIVDNALERVDARTWNHALEAFEDRKNTSARIKFRTQMSMNYNRVETLFREMKIREALTSDFDVKSAREMIEIINHSLFKMLLGGEISKADYEAKIMQFVRCILSGQSKTVSALNH